MENNMDRMNRKSDLSERRPLWLKKRLVISSRQDRVREILKDLNLHTVCQSALCPNISECFGKGTATFMILGNICTRNCRFCAVTTGEPQPVDNDEPKRLSVAVRKLGLKHVVITSVTRDDLSDGGATHFAKTIDELHKEVPETTVEVLTPDFQGNEEALKTVILSRPDIFNHNLETVPRLYPMARHKADYRRSLRILNKAKELNPEIPTKSGIMLGLGEERSEVSEVMRDLRDVDCSILTVGQYLSPSKSHTRIKKYVHPEVFLDIEREAKELGFLYAACSPFVRSSFNAAEAFELIGDRVHRG